MPRQRRESQLRRYPRRQQPLKLPQRRAKRRAVFEDETIAFHLLPVRPQLACPLKEKMARVEP